METISKPDTTTSRVPKPMKAYLKTYFPLLALLLSAAGLINWLIDPLWYGGGNRITGQNFSFNERISKTNLFLHTKPKTYDCLILGSSRVTLVKASSFKKNHCFNYSFSAGRIEEFVAYAKYAKEKGLNPKVVYVGVDAFNFDKSTPKFTGVGEIEPQPIYRAYFSLDVLLYSTRTLLGMSPDPRYYNEKFDSEVVANPPVYKPQLLKDNKHSSCDTSKIGFYKELRQVFPQAKFIGYVPPISAWNVVNESYSRGVMDCQLQAFYEVSKFFDTMYDLSIPSSVTTQVYNTYDGSHYYPEVQNEVTKILEGQPLDFGVRMNDYTFDKYNELYNSRIKNFLAKEGKENVQQAKF